MKHTFNKNILALLVLATAGLSAGAHAANQATVKITATVAETFNVDPIAPVVFDANLSAKEVTIHPTSNLAAGSHVKVTLKGEGENMDGDKLTLHTAATKDGKAAKIHMDATLDNVAVTFKDGKVEKKDAVTNTDLHLTLTPVAAEVATAEAGTYTSELKVLVERA